MYLCLWLPWLREGSEGYICCMILPLHRHSKEHQTFNFTSLQSNSITTHRSNTPHRVYHKPFCPQSIISSYRVLHFTQTKCLSQHFNPAQQCASAVAATTKMATPTRRDKTVVAEGTIAMAHPKMARTKAEVDTTAALAMTRRRMAAEDTTEDPNLDHHKPLLPVDLSSFSKRAFFCFSSAASPGVAKRFPSSTGCSLLDIWWRKSDI